MSNGRTNLKIKSLTNNEYNDIQQHIPKRSFEKGLMRKTIIFKGYGSKMVNAVAFSWEKDGKLPEDICMESCDDKFIIKINKKEYEVQRNEK